MFSWECATELLKRGAAMQTYDNQQNQDLGMALHNGDLDSAIDIDRTGLCQVQVKNSVKSERVAPNPEAAGKCPNTCPILSIVMQLGVDEEYHGPLVEIDTTTIQTDTPAGNTRSSTSSDPTDIKRCHYSSVLYGCVAATYSCVGGHAAIYATLLRTPALFHNYSRDKYPDFLTAAHELSPNMNKDGIFWTN
ncbi:hypothetical protein E1B28_010866 [Marasmius oreades]|uniref:Uncharacterized protein n=1 Tax=Marasmius oreades TaxID=181124 RepID=A0A9P7RT15_9AGAR|nr:uncharacterized protein E1B28_010866 [Marasmius oreades]KAG7089160.1 hypothetical protein E1B28_010866 [Marasmius oreades]